MIGKAASGTLKVGTTVATTLLTKALAQYWVFPVSGGGPSFALLQNVGTTDYPLGRSSFDGSPRLVAMSGGGERSRKVSGAWVLKGTRMPVSAIFENLEAGANLTTSWSGMTASIANR